MTFNKMSLLVKGDVVMAIFTISKYSRLMFGIYFPTGGLSYLVTKFAFTAILATPLEYFGVWIP